MRDSCSGEEFVDIGRLEVVLTLLLAVQVVGLVVSGMKGRWVWFVLGLVLWVPALIGAALPPRPASLWAQRREKTEDGDHGSRRSRGKNRRS